MSWAAEHLPGELTGEDSIFCAAEVHEYGLVWCSNVEPCSWRPIVMVGGRKGGTSTPVGPGSIHTLGHAGFD